MEMAKPPAFPLIVRNGSVVVKIYRQKAATTKDGIAYCVSWIGERGRARKLFADLAAAREDADRQAAHLAKGMSDSLYLDRSDILELNEARTIVGDYPLLSALREWSKARELAGGSIVEACTRWSEQRINEVKRIKIDEVVKKFIAAKDAVGKEGTYTYTSKLKPLVEFFPDVYLDTITSEQWTRYLNQFEDHVTRNDLRKRAVTLCRWAQRNGYLSDNIKVEIEKTERSKEVSKPIGILQPQEFHKILHYFWRQHPEYLAAVAIAGFCGLRADEIQGKRKNRDLRQSWSDIHFDQKFLSVTAAKENTPAWRVVPLQPVVLAWLRLCPNRIGPICEPLAMQKVRALAKAAKFTLPANCFRHSFITYRIAQTGNKPSTSTEAGNSVKEIDKCYRVPRPKADGKHWFSLVPDA